MSIDTLAIRKDFTVLNKEINGKPPIYMDNACVTLKPASVIGALTKYYNEFPGCHGRSLHYLGERTSREYNLARQAVQRFINARRTEEIIFLRYSTEGRNLLCYIIPLKGKKVLISELEHNSNLLPWQKLKIEKGIEYSIFNLNEDLTFSLERFKEKLDKDVGLVSVPHVSNVTGVLYPIRDIAQLAHQNGSLILVDGAQGAASNKIDVQGFDADFYVFSAHKMLGPSGVGCLYGKKELLENYPPFLIGGETVTDSKTDSFTLADLPDKYEAGLQNYAGAMGFRAAADYIAKIGVEKIKSHLISLNSMLFNELLEDRNIILIGPRDPKLRGGIFNFYIDGVDSFMVGDILNKSKNIMVRCGKHCTHSWYNKNRIPDSIRASFFIYNTPEEVSILAQEIKLIIKYYRQ